MIDRQQWSSHSHFQPHTLSKVDLNTYYSFRVSFLLIMFLRSRLIEEEAALVER